MKTSLFEIYVKKFLLLACAAITAWEAQGQFLPGDLALVRLGDGTQTLGNTGNTVFIDEYSALGALVSSLQIPDSGSSALIMSGNATSEGALSLAGNSSSLVIAGYNTARPAASSLAASL